MKSKVSLLLIAFVTSGLATDLCSQESTCESCYSTSLLCHWCKDIPSESGSPASCHYKLSPKGCQVGDACTPDDCGARQTCSSCAMGGCKWCASAQKCVSPYSWTCAFPSNCLPNSECQRKEPEFIGYIQAIPSWLIALFAILYVGMTILTVLALYHLRKTMVPSRVVDIEEEALVARARSRKWLFRGIASLSVLALATVGAGLTLISLFWPSSPQISMCNAELMWSDTLNMIINTITTGRTTVESELLITVYNPNRIGARINTVNGNIYYKGSSVGTIDLNPLDAKAGSASDALGVLTFDGFDHITEIMYDFNIKHQLFLEFEMFVNFDIGKVGGFSLAAPRFQMNVNNPPPQEHCKCKETSLTQVTGLDYEFE
jgi:hypothetical protein